MSFLGSPAANCPLLACLYPLALSCGVICTWLFVVMRTEVNQKVPEPDRISALFGYPGLLPKIEKLHRQFYPQSRLRAVLNGFIILGLLAVMGIAYALHLV